MANGTVTGTASGTVIVGGSVGGIAVATELRRLGYPSPVTVLDAQADLPYDRPPLSKGVLTGAVGHTDLAFHPVEHYAELGITIRTAARAVDLSEAPLAVALDDGSRVPAETVVIACGARARTLPAVAPADAVWTLRTLADALGLRSALARAERVAVVGAGFIGAEVASSARSLGKHVTVLESAARPFAALLGAEVADRLAGLHADAGTDLRCGVQVTGIETRGAGRRVRLGTGSPVDADVVVVGVGAVPEVEWLAGTGLLADAGVACDDRGRTRRRDVFAVGDVAAWADAAGVPERHEHWTSAREQAGIVAREIAGLPAPAWHAAIPYVWSDQYGKRVQVFGRPADADEVRVGDEDRERGSFVATYRRAGDLVAVVGCDAAAKVMRYRRELRDGAARRAG